MYSGRQGCRALMYLGRQGCMSSEPSDSTPIGKTPCSLPSQHMHSLKLSCLLLCLSLCGEVSPGPAGGLGGGGSAPETPPLMRLRAQYICGTPSREDLCRCFDLWFLFFFAFLGPHLPHMEVPRVGSNRSCSCQPQPQPLQRQI